MAITEVTFAFVDFFGGKGYGSLKTSDAITASGVATFVDALAAYTDAKPTQYKLASKVNLPVPSPTQGSEVEYSASLTYEDTTKGKNYVVPLIGVKKTALEMGSDLVPRHVVKAVRDEVGILLSNLLGRGNDGSITFLRDFVSGRNGRRV